MSNLSGKQTELGQEAVVSINKATFNAVLAAPRIHLVDLLHDLIRRGHLIIWNPSRNEFVRDGDIARAEVIRGKTIKISLTEKKPVDIEKWCET